MRRIALVAVIGVLLVVAAACSVPLSTPGDTSSITLVSSTTKNGRAYDSYRNNAYPCAVSGYQTFVVGRKIGSSSTVAKPLWVFMHGGGFGYFDSNGNPIPNANQKTEESAASLIQTLNNDGLMADIRADGAGFRTLSVSYCSHDLYAGADTTDPNNPNTTPAGKPRLTNGALSPKAAIQFVETKYPTTKFFLHGGSAGSAGTYSVAWSLQQQGIPPAGIVADASVINLEAYQAENAAGYCTDNNSPDRLAGIKARISPEIANVNNEPDRLVASGRLTVPIMHIWNHGDVNTCGSPPIACPMRDGSTVTMGATDCIHEPLRQAIAAQGATRRSKNLPVCVDNDPNAHTCAVHVVTNKAGLVNTDPSTPVDYLGAIMTWVHARLADA